MPDKEFCLLREPWIAVMQLDGKMKEVSLTDLFRHAHEYRQLAGELPTQDVAMLRLLLAVLHAVFGRYAPDGSFSPISEDGDPEATPFRRWKALWDLGTFPMAAIEPYLNHYEERFYLFHPTTPFFQVPFVSPFKDAKGEIINTSEKEPGYFIGDIAEGGNKARLFSARTQKKSLRYAESARWLIHLNAFDVAPGGRPPASGYTVKGYGLPWPSRLGLVWANGETLFHTLMLNLQLSAAPENGDMGVDWEKETVCDAEALKDIKPVFPRYLAGLYTMQFRRVRLERNEAEQIVTKCVIWGGQSLDEQNPLLENMTLFKWGEGTRETAPVIPKLNDPNRQLWRDFSALLPNNDQGKLTPGVVKWIEGLENRGYLHLPVMQLNTAGSEYSKNTALSNVFSDSLRVNLGLFSVLGTAWVSRITMEIQTTELAVQQLSRLARSLAVAAGNTDKKSLKQAGNAAARQAYFMLDEPFRNWLEGLDPEKSDMETACEEWWKRLQKISRGLAQELVRQAGPISYVGREFKFNTNDEKQLYTAPRAYNSFLYRISSRETLQNQKGGK